MTPSGPSQDPPKTLTGRLGTPPRTPQDPPRPPQGPPKTPPRLPQGAIRGPLNAKDALGRPQFGPRGSKTATKTHLTPSRRPKIFPGSTPSKNLVSEVLGGVPKPPLRSKLAHFGIILAAFQGLFFGSVFDAILARSWSCVGAHAGGKNEQKKT